MDNNNRVVDSTWVLNPMVGVLLFDEYMVVILIRIDCNGGGLFVVDVSNNATKQSKGWLDYETMEGTTDGILSNPSTEVSVNYKS